MNEIGSKMKQQRYKQDAVPTIIMHFQYSAASES